MDISPIEATFQQGMYPGMMLRLDQ
jgi:hypothetical protein